MCVRHMAKTEFQRHIEVASKREDSSKQFGVVKYTSSFEAGNPRLTPKGLVQMLEAVTGMTFSVAVAHRSQIRMGSVTKPKPDAVLLRSAARYEGFQALKARFGKGPWAQGLENRPHGFTAGKPAPAAVKA
eukprot:scaffold621392_cov51-Prasinocladus_malaysianus.AAC.1